jgi:hypothetical protein
MQLTLTDLQWSAPLPFYPCSIFSRMVFHTESQKSAIEAGHDVSAQQQSILEGFRLTQVVNVCGTRYAGIVVILCMAHIALHMG